MPRHPRPCSPPSHRLLALATAWALAAACSSVFPEAEELAADGAPGGGGGAVTPPEDATVTADAGQGGGTDALAPPTDATPAADTGFDQEQLCGELGSAYLAEAAALGGCGTPDDCTGIPAVACLGINECEGIVVNKDATDEASSAALQAAAQAYTAAGCEQFNLKCPCAPPTLTSYGCDAGSCVRCDYQCDLGCTCAKDARGCDLPSCVPEGCPAIEDGLDALAAPLQEGCIPTVKGCTHFEYPICGSFGCLQIPVLEDADTSALLELAVEGQQLGCPGISCGCGPPQPAVCLDGRCGMCPPDCSGSCIELQVAADTVAGQLQRGCTEDSDCLLLESPFCNVPPLGCFATAINTIANTTSIDAIIASWDAQGCVAPVACNCTKPQLAVCEEGLCVAK